MTTVHTARFIHAQSGAYPLTLPTIRTTLEPMMLPKDPSFDLLQQLGYFKVTITERPIADVVVEGSPELLEGTWYSTWTSRDFNEQEQQERLERDKQTRISQVRELRDQALEKGHPYTFPDESVQHIQLRDGDRANLAGLDAKASRTILDETTDVTFLFRTYENNVIEVTPEQMLDITNSAFTGYMAIMRACWELESDIMGAVTVDDLPEVPYTLIQQQDDDQEA